MSVSPIVVSNLEQEPPLTGESKEVQDQKQDEVLPIEPKVVNVTETQIQTMPPQEKDIQQNMDTTNQPIYKVIEVEPVKVNSNDVVRRRKKQQ